MVPKFLLIALLAWQCMANPVQKTPVKNILKNIRADPINMEIESLKYTISLTLKKDFHEAGNNEFDGVVDVNFGVKEGAAAINEIKIHCAEFIGNGLNEQISKITLTIDRVPARIENPTYDAENEILTIPVSRQIDAGSTNVNLRIIFVGSIYNDLRGLYLSSYTTNVEDKNYVLATQFAPTYARRAFPCFDEPEYKAIFKITIIHPEPYKVLSNTKGTLSTPSEGMMTTTFDETTLMSTYLVAFAVHTMVPTEVIADKMNIYYPKELYGETAGFAQGISESILNEFVEYTGKNWEGDGVTKIDQIVIPEIAVGAMENWGLVTYRDVNFLRDDDNSGTYNKEKIVSTIAHEFAHNWFGNLITLEKWDYIWLHEGLSTFFAHYVANQIDENYETMKQFLVVEQQGVFVTDAAENSVSLNAAADEISNKLNDISYNKGAAIVHMMYQFLGEDKFKTGIKKYLESTEVVNPTKFFDSFDEVEGTSIMANLMNPWADQPGYPVVKVTYDAAAAEKKFKFAQERFVYPIDGEEEEETEETKQVNKNKKSKNAKIEGKWNIPIFYDVIKYEEEAPETKAETLYWLMDDAAEDEGIDVPDFTETDAIIVNIKQKGYYRVNYDENLWARIKTILDNKPEDIDELIRAQIVDDVLNLARAGHFDYEFAFQQIEFLAAETSYYPWYSALQSFSFLYHRLSVNNLRGAMQKYVQETIAQVYDAVNEGNPRKHIDILRKSLVYKWACEFEHPDCVQKALESFAAIDETPVEKELRSAVYCTAIRNGGEEEWSKLYGKFIDNNVHPTEKEVIRTALGCSLDAVQLRELLDVTILDDGQIKPHDRESVFKAVAIGNPEGVQVALDFLIKKSEDISSKYSSLNALTNIVNILADRITTEEQKDAFTAFVEDAENNHLGGAQPAAEAALQTLQTNLAWDESNADEMSTFLARYSTTTTTQGAAQISISFILLATVFIFGKLL